LPLMVPNVENMTKIVRIYAPGAPIVLTPTF
jgi:hypothetical protein